MEEIEVIRCLVKLSNRNVDLSYVVSLEVSKWDLRGDYCRSTHSCPKSYSATSAVHSWQNQDLHWSRLKLYLICLFCIANKKNYNLHQWICKHRVCSPLKKTDIALQQDRLKKTKTRDLVYQSVPIGIPCCTHRAYFDSLRERKKKRFQFENRRK